MTRRSWSRIASSGSNEIERKSFRFRFDFEALDVFRSMKRALGTDRRFEEGSVRMMGTSDSSLALEKRVKS